jgi:hypothetical protein
MACHILSGLVISGHWRRLRRNRAPTLAHGRCDGGGFLCRGFDAHGGRNRGFPGTGAADGSAGDVGAGFQLRYPVGWYDQCQYLHSGRFDAGSRFEGIRARWSEEQIAQRAELVSRIRWLVADGSELAHKAIGYLLAYDDVSCVIPGMRTLQQLASNLAAADCRVALADRRRLEELWDDATDKGSKLLPW